MENLQTIPKNMYPFIDSTPFTHSDSPSYRVDVGSIYISTRILFNAPVILIEHLTRICEMILSELSV